MKTDLPREAFLVVYDEAGDFFKLAAALFCPGRIFSQLDSLELIPLRHKVVNQWKLESVPRLVQWKTVTISFLDGIMTKRRSVG